MIPAGTKFIAINTDAAFNRVWTIEEIANAIALSDNAGVTEVSTTYAALTTDRSIKCTGATYTVSVFTAVGRSGRRLTITNAGTGVITVDPNGSETINGYTTISLLPDDSMSIESDDTNWNIV